VELYRKLWRVKTIEIGLAKALPEAATKHLKEKLAKGKEREALQRSLTKRSL